VDKKNEIVSLLNLVIFLIIVLILIFTSILGFDLIQKIKWYFIVTYIILGAVSIFAATQFKNKSLKIILTLIGLPIYIIFFLAIIALPYYLLIFHFVVFLIICFVLPISILQKLIDNNLINLSSKQALFIVLTLGTISTIVLNRKIISIVLFISPARFSDSKKVRSIYENNKLDIWLDRNNLRMFYYLVFLVYLFYYSFTLLSNEATIQASSFENTWLQAFLCFIAFDSLIINSKSIEVLPSRLLNEFKKLFNLSD
jgi:hypothetical protein